MKLKEIKQGMAIHCTSRDQVNYLVNIGVANKSLTKYDVPIWIHVIGNGICCWMPEVDKNGMKGKEFYEKDGCNCVEFSDLVIPEPELSAEEALLAYDQMCRENYCCNDCPIYGIVGDECTHKMDGHIGEIVNAIKQWKAEHEKKEPEIEWVYRVFGAENYGEKFFQTEEEAIKRCEELAKSHKTKQYARYERVCRVKEVE